MRSLPDFVHLAALIEVQIHPSHLFREDERRHVGEVEDVLGRRGDGRRARGPLPREDVLGTHDEKIVSGVDL